ncbi:ferredoxin [Kyrpidia tusciae]|uniref:Ferredoxin n=1 Tax=Kyrpidia tusciae (strain DSM 2912 / NBRC 15312 / T2) TaxID=562970 RepID=D5WTR0_KYRT2|nr:ferredoxin [Kyrpidia tusciae]ADG05230.1 4Fe-4S ferredoxin iron-sulfur binding domain protein [Kyrpidia tusciae DSM 2912]
MPKTWVERETCIACGACSAACPEVYAEDEDGFAFVKLPGGREGFVEIPEQHVADARDAFEGCPSESVKWQEDE